MKKIAILGAGISGLALSYYLQKYSADALDITIYEQAPNVGGWIESKKVQNAIFECGPRSLRTKGSGVAILELIEALKLQDAVIESAPLSKIRYIAQNNALQKLPNTFLDCLSSRFTPIFFKALTCDLIACKKSTAADESVHAFFSRRFGKKFTDTFIDPLTSGIWAANPKALSMQSTFSTLFDKEQAFGSCLIGLLCTKRKKEPERSFWIESMQNKMLSFYGGIQLLPQTLAQQVGATIYCNTPVFSLSERENQVFVDTQNGVKAYDALFSTLTAHTLKSLFATTNPLYCLLDTLSSTSLVTVSFGYQASLPLAPGFGFLCSAATEEELLGIVFDSNVFVQHNGCFSIRLSVMMGRTNACRLCAEDDETLRQKAAFFVKKYLKIEEKSNFCFVQKAQNAISCYQVGHRQKVDKIQNLLANSRIRLLGTSIYGVSVGDCIESAKNVAFRFCKKC